MHLILKTIFFLVFAGLLYSCSECPVEDDPVNDCNTRDATITLFNPRLTRLNDSTFTPVPEYSIQTFQFPDDNASSGSFPNDQRYEKADQIIVAERSFQDTSNEVRRAVIYDVYPSNSTIISDIMVVSVNVDQGNPLNSTALLRFYGTVGSFPAAFPSENAEDFCQNYLKQFDDDELKQIKSTGSRYGSSHPNARTYSYTQSDISVLNSDGKIIPNAFIPPNVVSDLLAQAGSNAIDIEVRPGEVYYYKARNGKEFAMVITDIRPGTFTPFKKRVSIFFAEI